MAPAQRCGMSPPTRSPDSSQDPIPSSQVGNALGFFEPSFAFLQIARQGLAFFLCAFAFRDVLDRAEKSVVLSDPFSDPASLFQSFEVIA